MNVETMNAERLLTTAQQRVAEKLASRQTVKAASIPPETLTLILETIMMVVERCLESRRDEDVVESVRVSGVVEKLAVRRAVRRLLRETHGPFGFARYNGSEMAEAILDAGQEASGDERQALVEYVRQQML